MANTEGAFFSRANPYMTREVENTPELAEEAAEVRTTKLTMWKAMSTPMKLNISTNGDLSGSMRSHGCTDMMTPKAST